MELWPHQIEVHDQIINAWGAGHRFVAAVLPTGSGKTVLFTRIMGEHRGASIAIAHRHELVSQISMALCGNEIQHRIIGARSAIDAIITKQIKKFGQHYVDPRAAIGVASVDTLIRRKYDWYNRVTLWVQDECHHILRDNKWGRAVALFPNAKGLGVTATLLRSDNKGLGAHTDGVFHTAVIGQSMRGIIDAGYLTDYRIFCPTTEALNLADVPISKATGDYSQKRLITHVRKSKIVGNVVENYVKIAPGKLGITFATDVTTAGEICDEYRAAGVSAESVSYKTPAHERAAILARFERREVTQIVNVDLFGEGFDLPAVEVCSFARPTASYGLFVQQFGRALRIMDGKESAIIIDHVGNVIRHGLPDRERDWTLDRQARRVRGETKGEVPIRVCAECTGAYSALMKCCPYCGHVHTPQRRNGPEFVDGDIFELNPETLARMRRAVRKVNRSPLEYERQLTARGLKPLWARGHANRYARAQQSRAVLRDTIAQWAGIQGALGLDDSQRMRLFFYTFGVDMLSAQALSRSDTEKLNEEIANKNKGVAHNS